MIKKTSLISTDTVDKIKIEKEILLDTEHPFVIRMEYMF
jgi:serine/threonine protein kinase